MVNIALDHLPAELTDLLPEGVAMTLRRVGDRVEVAVPADGAEPAQQLRVAAEAGKIVLPERPSQFRPRFVAVNRSGRQVSDLIIEDRR